MDERKFYYSRYGLGRSQWPRGLRHEPFSPAPTLGHGCFCAFILLFVLFCVQIAALRRADPPSKESYRLSVD
jgi:hypothetical protein